MEHGTRETPREGDSPRPRPPFTPSRLLLAEHQRAGLVKHLTLVVLFAGLLLIWRVVALLTGEQRVMVIDPVGGVTQGPIEPLATSRSYFSITSLNAVHAALQRSSAGFDLLELLPLYFDSRARTALETHLSDRQEDYKRRRLSTKPVIESITPPEPAGNARVVRVTGRLQTTGLVNGRVFYEEPPFEMILLFRPNSDLSNKATMPWVVDDFELLTSAEELSRQRDRRRSWK